MAIDQEERLQRIDRLAALARAEGLAGVLLSAESNVDYFAGYRHHAPWTVFARPYLLLITVDGKASLIAHSFLAPEVERTAMINDLRTYTRSGSAPVDLIAETMADLGVTSGRIGAELGEEQRLGVSWQDFAAIQRAVPQIEFVDVASLIWRLRRIKSPAEIEILKKAAEITGRAFEACFEVARPGMSEREIAAIGAEAMVRNGAERPGFVLIASGAENYTRLSGRPTERVLEPGDMLWIDMGLVYEGYWSDFCRAAVMGQPSQEQCDKQQVILDVNQACLEAVRIGEPVKRIAEAVEDRFKTLGFDVRLGNGRVGHGIGLMSTEPPHVAHYEETIMEDGLVFTIEPRLTSSAGVFNVEELVLVTRLGPTLLTTTPRDLTIIR
jgi:Xaa-Pro aminopeptidase